MESTVFTHILSFFKQWEGTYDLQMHSNFKYTIRMKINQVKIIKNM